jgi:hypothetical protein
MMSELASLSRRDLVRISAYLDGQLSAKQAGRLEARLKVEPALREALEGLRQTKRLLRSLPEVRAARRFTLTPEMVGLRERRATFSALRLATVAVTVVFVAVIGMDALWRGLPMLGAAPSVAGGERMAALESEEVAPAADEAAQMLAAPAEPQAEAELEVTQEVELLQAPPSALEGGGGEATQAPEKAGNILLTPSPIPTPELLEETAETGEVATGRGIAWVPDLLRGVEVGLGAAALVLAVFTARAWKKRRP